MKKRNIMYIVISIICIIAIVIAVYYQIFAKKVIDESAVNEIANTIVADSQKADNPEDLLQEFNKLFTNNLNKQKFGTMGVTKVEGYEEQDVIYTAYDIQEEKDGQYSIDIKLPVFNIIGDVPTEFNGITQSIFADKVNSIFAGPKQYTIYDVKYTAYLNENILSLAIKSTLKEGNSAQRIIVQTYNYDIETGKKVTLNEILEKNEIDKKEVNKKIENQVKEASKQAQAISEATGQIVYKRDVNNAMYITDNVSNFLVGKDGQIYIIYAYGNNKITSEIDIIKL